MLRSKLTARQWGERFLLALFFVAVGALIIVVFSPWRPLLAKLDDYLGRLALVALLAILFLLLNRRKESGDYAQVVYGLLIMAVVVSLDWIINTYLLDYVGVNDKIPAGFTLLKLNEGLVIISVIVLFTRLSRSSLGAIYIQKGNLKLGLTIGLAAFFHAAAGSIPMAKLMFNLQDLNLAKLGAWTPWILIFVLVNAALEEIMFRGLFLRKLQPFFGKFISNLLIALVFTVLHGSVTYTPDQYLFLVVLFPLALAWGYIMQKTDSVWGSILFHAGMDIPIVLGIFSNLP